MSITAKSVKLSEDIGSQGLPLNTVVPPTIAVAEGTNKKTVQTHKFIESVNGQDTTASDHPKWELPTRINPDSGIFIRLVVIGVAIAGLVAFAISFVSLYAVAEWLGLPRWMWWAVPVFIDLAILVYAALVLVHKARGEHTWPSWSALGAFTLLSVIANGAHALSHDHDTQWQAIIGVFIAAMVPIAIFVATEQLSRVAVEDLNSRKTDIQYQITLETLAAEQHQAREQLAFEAEQHQWRRENQRLTAQRESELAQRHHELKLAGITNTKDRPANGLHSAKNDVPTIQTVRRSPSRKNSGGDQELVVYLGECVAAGHEITGALIAEFLGVSDRTGRRRIQKLQHQHPDLFNRDEVSGNE